MEGGEHIDKPIEPNFTYRDVDPGIGMGMPSNYVECPEHYELRDGKGHVINQGFTGMQGIASDAKCYAEKGSD